MAEKELTAAQAIQIAEGLAAAGVRCWVMGGWGIDALLGEHTRAHHDLDLLVAMSDLPSLEAWLRREGFCRAYEWQENAPAGLHGESWDTAFVAQHGDGRELHIQAVRIEDTEPVWRGLHEVVAAINDELTEMTVAYGSKLRREAKLALPAEISG